VHQVSVCGRAYGGRRAHLPQALLQMQDVQEQPQIEQLRTGRRYFVLQDVLREGDTSQERPDLHVIPRLHGNQDCCLATSPLP